MAQGHRASPMLTEERFLREREEGSTWHCDTWGVVLVISVLWRLRGCLLLAASFKSRRRSLRSPERGRRSMMPRGLVKPTVHQVLLPCWNNAICRHAGCIMPVMIPRPYG